MPCDLFFKGFDLDCTVAPLQGGYGFNYSICLAKHSDCFFTVDGTGKVTGITLPAGRAFYRFAGATNASLTHKSELVNSDSGQKMYKHMATFKVLSYSALDKQNMERLANAKVVALISHSLADGNRWEILGDGAGMEVSALTQGNENQNAAMVTISSTDTELEARMPKTFFLTSVPLTQAYVEDSLLFTPKITALGSSSFASAGPFTAITVTGKGFFGGVGANSVTGVSLVNTKDNTNVTIATFAFTSDTTGTFTPAAGIAVGTYILRVYTIRGFGDSSSIINVT